MCPGMAAEALRLGDASAEKVEQDLASPMGLLGWQGGFGSFVMRQLQLSAERLNRAQRRGSDRPTTEAQTKVKG